MSNLRVETNQNPTCRRWNRHFYPSNFYNFLTRTKEIRDVCLKYNKNKISENDQILPVILSLFKTIHVIVKNSLSQKIRSL